MHKLNVKVNKNEINYPIFISQNAIENLPNVLSEIKGKKLLVVTNETIFEIYEEAIREIFNIQGTHVEYCVIQDGEKYKNKVSLEKILTCAFEAKFERNDTFIAFGGGVVGDITGFAASIYLRGVNFVQIPTTILAQVDSSVGGKVAIDTAYGKNLIGAFYQPNAVISDLNFLKTLPKREVLTGLSEVVKYSFIEKNCGSQFIDFAKFLSENKKDILALNNEKMSEVVKISCDLKANVVAQDEKEKGLRAILNFGHTIGHAIEKVTNYYVYTHGEAIAMGMKAVFLISKSLKKIDDMYFDFGIKLLDAYGLNFKLSKDIKESDILNALIYDKKVHNGKVRFVLPVAYAEVGIFDDINQDVIESALKELY